MAVLFTKTFTTALLYKPSIMFIICGPFNRDSFNLVSARVGLSFDSSSGASGLLTPFILSNSIQGLRTRDILAPMVHTCYKWLHSLLSRIKHKKYRKYFPSYKYVDFLESDIHVLDKQIAVLEIRYFILNNLFLVTTDACTYFLRILFSP